MGRFEVEKRSQTVASTSSLWCGCERRSFRTVTVEHPTLQKALCCMINSFCVNNDFGRFSAIFIVIFLVVCAYSLDVSDTLRISEIDREHFKKPAFISLSQ